MEYANGISWCMANKEILSLRNKIGLSQKQLAQALGLESAGTIYRWENGLRAPNEALRRIFCYLDDLPEEKARKVIEKISEYGTSKKRPRK